MDGQTSDGRTYVILDNYTSQVGIIEDKGTFSFGKPAACSLVTVVKQ